jgi:hypothetical protein
MRDRAAVLRLGLAPVLLLAWNAWMGDPLPFLAPSLLVPILLAGAARPPIAMLAGIVLLVGLLSSLLAFGFVALADSPASVWMLLLALATWGFARLDAAPDAVAPLLALMTAAMVTVLARVAPTLALDLPWLMTGATVQAVVAALLAHALLPSRVPLVRTPALRALPPGGASSALLRGTALVVALGVAMAAGDTSAILIAVTAINMLRVMPAEARGQGKATLLANLGAAVLVLPAVGLAALRPDPVTALALSLAASLWLASGLAAGPTGLDFTRRAAGIFVVLAGLLLPEAGEGSLAMLGDRLLTLLVTMLGAVALHALLRRPARPA